MYLRRRLSGSVVSLSCPKVAERFAVLLEVRRGEVVHLVLLQKRIHLHPRLEAKQPAKLSCRERVGPICLKRQTLERSPGQILPLGSELLHDVLWQFQCNLHGGAVTSLSQGQGLRIISCALPGGGTSEIRRISALHRDQRHRDLP